MDGRARDTNHGDTDRGLRIPDATSRLGWAGFVWAYALIWALISDQVKLLAYRIFDPVKADPAHQAKQGKGNEKKAAIKYEPTGAQFWKRKSQMFAVPYGNVLPVEPLEPVWKAVIMATDPGSTAQELSLTIECEGRKRNGRLFRPISRQRNGSSTC
jgi:hypothetical protein